MPASSVAPPAQTDGPRDLAWAWRTLEIWHARQAELRAATEGGNLENDAMTDAIGEGCEAPSGTLA